jgi:hypothetical protein
LIYDYAAHEERVDQRQSRYFAPTLLVITEFVVQWVEIISLKINQNKKLSDEVTQYEYEQLNLQILIAQNFSWL